MSRPQNPDWSQPPPGQTREPAWWEQQPQRPPTWGSPAQSQSPYQPHAYYAQPTRPGGYPPPTPPQPSQPSTGGKLWLLAGVGVLLGLVAAAVLALVVLKPSFLGGKVLDVNKAQAGVQQILTDPTNGYGIDNVSNVKCNNGKNPSAKKGATFTCEVQVDGKSRKVNVVVSDDKGTYEVDRPR